MSYPAVHRQYCMKINTYNTSLTCTYPSDTQSLKTLAEDSWRIDIETESFFGLSWSTRPWTSPVQTPARWPARAWAAATAAEKMTATARAAAHRTSGPTPLACTRCRRRSLSVARWTGARRQMSFKISRWPRRANPNRRFNLFYFILF